MPRSITTAERRARLAVRHRLAPSARVDDDLVAVARSVVVLHATDPSTVVLSAMARMRRPDAAAVEHALYEDRLIVRMHAMRRTMFTCATEDAALLQRSSADAVAAAERRKLVTLLEQKGVTEDAEGWLAKVGAKTLAAVAERGEVAASDLTKVVAELAIQIPMAEGKSYAGTIGVSSRVLNLLGMEGRLVRARPKGRWTSSQHRWAPLDTWLGGPLADIPVAEAQVELTRRWLERRGRSPTSSGGPAGRSEPHAPPWLRWRRRRSTWTARRASCWPVTSPRWWSPGNAGPTVWVDGRIVGGWAHHRSGEVVVRLLEDVGTERAGLVAAAAAELPERLGEIRIVPRFPAPLDKELSA